MTHGPLLPIGAGVSGGYNGASWSMRLTIKDKTYSYTHPCLWDAIRQCIRQYDEDQQGVKR